MCGFKTIYDVLEIVYRNIYNGLMLESSLKPKTFVEALKIIYHNPYKKLTLNSIINYKTFKNVYSHWWMMIYNFQCRY